MVGAKVFRFLFAALLMFAAAPSYGLVELKGGYSVFNPTPNGLNDGFTANPKITQFQGLSVDIMGNVPLMPIGLGLRHEIFKKTEGDDTLGSEIEWTRTSILVNKRFFDTLLYIGPIATVSIASDFKYRSKTSGVSTTYKTDSTISGTVGVEAGLKLVLLRIGAEAGFMYAPLGQLKDNNGADHSAGGVATKVDLSGPYMRALIGFGF